MREGCTHAHLLLEHLLVGPAFLQLAPLSIFKGRKSACSETALTLSSPQTSRVVTGAGGRPQGHCHSDIGCEGIFGLPEKNPLVIFSVHACKRALVRVQQSMYNPLWPQPQTWRNLCNLRTLPREEAREGQWLVPDHTAESGSWLPVGRVFIPGGQAQTSPSGRVDL